MQTTINFMDGALENGLLTKATDWFPGDIKPVYVGWYETSLNIGIYGDAKIAMDSMFQTRTYFDGENWLRKNGSIKDMTRMCGLSGGYMQWRGMSQPLPGQIVERTDGKELKIQDARYFARDNEFVITYDGKVFAPKSINDVKHVTPGLWTHVKYYFGRVVSFFKRLLGFS